MAEDGEQSTQSRGGGGWRDEATARSSRGREEKRREETTSSTGGGTTRRRDGSHGRGEFTVDHNGGVKGQAHRSGHVEPSVPDSEPPSELSRRRPAHAGICCAVFACLSCSSAGTGPVAVGGTANADTPILYAASAPCMTSRRMSSGLEKRGTKREGDGEEGGNGGLHRSGHGIHNLTWPGLALT